MKKTEEILREDESRRVKLEEISQRELDALSFLVHSVFEVPGADAGKERWELVFGRNNPDVWH